MEVFVLLEHAELDPKKPTRSPVVLPLCHGVFSSEKSLRKFLGELLMSRHFILRFPNGVQLFDKKQHVFMNRSAHEQELPGFPPYEPLDNLVMIFINDLHTGFYQSRRTVV